MPRKTKIIATISNLHCSPEFIRRLHEEGMNVARLNTAHMTHDDALEVIENIRAVSEKIGILVDTKGPEIRTCDCESPLKVEHEDLIRIKGAPDEISRADVVCVSYDRIVKDIPIGSTVLIDDGYLSLEVMDKDDDFLYCRAQNDGVIKARKSLNIPAVHVTLPALSQKDIGFIKFSADHDVDFIAHSFVRSKEDVMAVQKILDEKKSPIKIIAKIENSQGVDNLNEILDHAYGIMIARGDLAVEIPTEKIPLIQKKMVRTCIEKRRPVIVATQMLHSMIVSPRPTRAEVSDVANACLDHADAIMLSGETASGKYPLEAIKIMAKIAEEVEMSESTFMDVPYTIDDKITAYLAKAAVKASLRLHTEAIVADSMTGKSIRALAAYRGDNPIFARVYDKNVMRQLSLSFGVYADYIPLALESTQALQQSVCTLLETNHIKDDTLIIVLAGSFGIQQGASYIEVSTALNFKNNCK